MGKAKAPRRLADNEARAVLRTIRVSPQKLNLVAALIRGKKVATALADLEFSRKRIAGTVRKTLESAIANAENNHDLVGDEMLITSITVDEGPTLKRYRPRAQGRATPIHKRTSHIAVALTPAED